MSLSALQKKWIGTLSLALALGALWPLASWYELKQRPKEEKAELEGKKLFDLGSQTIKSYIVNNGKDVVELNCSDFAQKLCKPGENSKWELNQPIKAKADDTNANEFLSAMNNLTATEIISLTDETAEKRTALLKEYGLDPASRALATNRKITITTEKGPWIAYLGLAHPVNDGIFAVVEKPASTQGGAAQIDENKIFLVPSWFKDSIEHDLGYWRNKKLLTITSNEVESFTLESKKAGSIQGQRKEGGWILQSKNEEMSGDIENIDSILAGATSLVGKSIAAENKNDEKTKGILKDYQNILTLTLVKKKENDADVSTPIQLKFFGKETGTTDRLFALTSNLDSLFEMELDATNRLDKSAKDLRLVKLITSMERFSAKKLSFKGKTLGNDPLTLVNQDGKWLLEKNKAEAQSDKVQNLLEKLSGNRIQDFIIDASAKASPADEIELTLSDEKNNPKRQFLFWKKDGKLYARDLLSSNSQKKQETLVVDITLRDGLPWDPDFFNKSTK